LKDFEDIKTKIAYLVDGIIYKADPRTLYESQIQLKTLYSLLDEDERKYLRDNAPTILRLIKNEFTIFSLKDMVNNLLTEMKKLLG